MHQFKIISTEQTKNYWYLKSNLLFLLKIIHSYTEKFLRYFIIEYISYNILLCSEKRPPHLICEGPGLLLFIKLHFANASVSSMLILLLFQNKVIR